MPVNNRPAGPTQPAPGPRQGPHPAGGPPKDLPNNPNPALGESFITGSEVPAPSQAFSVTDYPYLTPSSVDFAALVYLVTAILLGIALVLWRREQNQSLLARTARWLKRHRVVSVLLFFICLEIILHTTSYYSSQRLYRPSHVGFYALTPRFGAGNDMTNSMGLADRELPLEKPVGKHRIICMGDSTTMGGAGAVPSETYPRQLQHLLNNRSGQENWDVINAGVSGYTTYQGLFLLRKVALKYHPDILVIAYGYHDGMLDWAEDKFHMTDNRLLVLLRGILYKLQTYLVIRKQVLNLETVHHKASQDAPSFYRVAADDYRHNLEFFIKIARMNGMKIIFINMPYRPGYEARMAPSETHRNILRRTMQTYASDPSVGFIDIYKQWINLSGMELKKRIFDHSHPTVYGHKLIAETLLDFIDSRWPEESEDRGSR